MPATVVELDADAAELAKLDENLARAELTAATRAPLTWLAHPAFVALPAFVGLGLVFGGLTDTCAVGLLLVRMPWNR